MAKQLVLSALEEVFHEYVLNMDKENLKIAALRGKIKLENVQLDGDVLGSHVMGIFGLQGFGVLSCYAKSLKISVPWKNLEKEPTRFEVRGIHLVCVPLTPMTANKMYGSGTRADPRCSLRTRAKRLVLARYERSFWNGQIPDEGPPLKRVQRAVKQVERELRKNAKAAAARDDDIESAIESLFADLEADDSAEQELNEAEQDLPDIPRDWKVKLREKILRNMEASLHDVHIRCEVSEGAVAVSPAMTGAEVPADERSFALGFTLESLTVRTANENWQVGSHDKRNPVDGSGMSSAEGHLGPNPYVVKNNKIGYFRKLSIYWDDEPPVLLSQADALQGNLRKLAGDKLHGRLAAAMNALMSSQDIDADTRKGLYIDSPWIPENGVEHQYVVDSFDMEVRSRTSDRTVEGPISCSADVMPFNLSFNIQPHQYFQYNQLKKAMKAQERFDTMFRRRPDASPKDDPKAWWKYAIACVTSRPNSRSWEDVRQISQARSLYIELVMKKNLSSKDNHGYHSGLSEQESASLLEIENRLPVEALLALHLVALRRVYARQPNFESGPAASERKERSSSKFRLLSRGGSVSRRRKSYSELPRVEDEGHSESVGVAAPRQGMIGRSSILDSLTRRLGKKPWFVNWSFHDASVDICFASRKRGHVAKLSGRATGHIRSLGKGRRDFFFDLVQFDAHHRQKRVLFAQGLSMHYDNARGVSDRAKDKYMAAPGIGTIQASPDMTTGSTYVHLPSESVVCRVVGGKLTGKQNISVASQPLTFIWVPSFFDALSEFVSNQSEKQNVNLADYIRNAATPVARKAQLAFLSPSSMACHFNIAHPKVWIPVSSSKYESGLFVDSHTLQMRSIKEEGESSPNWDLGVNAIQVSFVRDLHRSLQEDPALIIRWLETGDIRGKMSNSIVKPFDIAVSAETIRSSDLRQVRGLGPDSLYREVQACVSPLLISLVDAEILARAFGRIYTRGLQRMQKGASSSSGPQQLTRKDSELSSAENALLQFRTMPQRAAFSLEKVEIYLEGHSKETKGAEDRSVASIHSTRGLLPSVRTYLITLTSVHWNRSRIAQKSESMFSLSDALIYRLDGARSAASLNAVAQELSGTQHAILTKTSCERDRSLIGERTEEASSSSILTLAHLHDGGRHLDEVEIDVDAITARVTPTTLKDFSKAFKRIAELTQLVTKEMERKVHEQGRRARLQDAERSEFGWSDSQSAFNRPLSPSLSEAVTDVSESVVLQNQSVEALDSSIIFRVTVRDLSLLAGQPSGSSEVSIDTSSFAVLQTTSTVLFMLQSIENADATGSRTLHLSVANLSSFLSSTFDRISPVLVPPILGPVALDFRLVYGTEGLGVVVSQDLKLNSESARACMTANDFFVMTSIAHAMVMRLRSANPSRRAPSADDGGSGVSGFLRYQKRGTGIATNIRFEAHDVSLVVLRAYQSHLGARDFLEVRLQSMKGSLDGCWSALSGDLSLILSARICVDETGSWEDMVEEFSVTISMEQMPDEVSLSVAPNDSIQVNLTGKILECALDMMKELSFRAHPSEIRSLDPSDLSTVGLRRASEARCILVKNRLGVDIYVLPDSSSFDDETGFVRTGQSSTLSGLVEEKEDGDGGFALMLRVAGTDIFVGEREPVFDLAVSPVPGRENKRLLLLRPSARSSAVQARLEMMSETDGRASPESVHGDNTAVIAAYYSAEPVIEQVVQNQRLRSSVPDMYALHVGGDLLSSGLWSPECDTVDGGYGGVKADTQDSDDVGADARVTIDEARSFGSPGRPSSTRGVSSPGRTDLRDKSSTSNWTRPYLKNDVPEFSDLTLSLELARERVMLPDSNWQWLNDWTVDISGEVGAECDTDGWEYEADFDAFGRDRRSYLPGDGVRRRRWTRTRMIRPPRRDDPLRMLKLVWDTSTDQQGNYCVEVRSHLRVHNRTNSPVSIFLYAPSWDEDAFAGVSHDSEPLHVPVDLATATFMRIAKQSAVSEGVSLENSVYSDRVCIIPTHYDGTNVIRTCVDLRDVSGTKLHYVIKICSQNGIVDVEIEPVLRIINLLPCELECHVGQIVHENDRRRTRDSRPVLGSSSMKASTAEILKVPSGVEMPCTAVNPLNRPHLSLRVAGYHWSPWHRIVNRKAEAETFLSPESDDDIQPPRSETDSGDEYKSLIKFARMGKSADSLIIIMSVECGHCPTVRIFAQYWIVDKTGFGCRFSEGFLDLLSLIPDHETARRSYLLAEDARDDSIRQDLEIPGHEWSLGMSGMTMYFSANEKLVLAIEAGAGDTKKLVGRHSIKSQWSQVIDISNVIPKTVFSLEEIKGPRRFELAISVTICPGMFSRTKLISLLPRYQVVNQLQRELVVGQDGCLDSPFSLPPHSSIPMHWEKGLLPPKVRFAAPVDSQRNALDKSWSNGCFRLDRVGITSMRLPTASNSSTPLVVQVEVRLAAKDQDCAVLVVVWIANERSNPLYVLRNLTPYTILCRQSLDESHSSEFSPSAEFNPLSCTADDSNQIQFQCGTDIGPSLLSFLGADRQEEYVWVLRSSETICYGFDDPQKSHVVEWTCVTDSTSTFQNVRKLAVLEIDAMGSSSILSLPNGKQIRCFLRAEHSTKVVEFVDLQRNLPSSPLKSLRSEYKQALEERDIVQDSMTEHDVEDEEIAFSLRFEMPLLSISVIDNLRPTVHGREILLVTFGKTLLTFSQSREGYHELEFKLQSFQVDNHVQGSSHPVLIFCPKPEEKEPLFHVSAVRRLQQHSNTFVFRYVAIRLLEVEIFMDRRTAETIARFIEPLIRSKDSEPEEPQVWVSNLTLQMTRKHAKPDRKAVRDVEMTGHSANSGRIYFEQLHLHPVRLGLTFTQEGIDDGGDAGESIMLFQFIRGVPTSISNAPLKFTSFVVGHVFEAPQALFRVIATHYSSQLTKQIFGLLGSLTILGAPADFFTNVGTGVRDFFYEPINGAVHGPRQFIEGLESGAQSLARGLFVGFVRGAANVADAVNSNLAVLTDEEFVEERKAHQRMLTDAMSRGKNQRSFNDSLNLAGASLARGVKSGALGLMEQPTRYASKHGPVGFATGVGRAVVGAVVKPVVGMGDAAVLVMNHMSDATAKHKVRPKIPKRLRRALPSRSNDQPDRVIIQQYDEKAAKAQKIVTGGESVDDVYLGHVNIPSHLIIVSEQCLWAIDRRTREPWCVSWEEISHFSLVDGGARVVIFSQCGLRSFLFQVEDEKQRGYLQRLLLMQTSKMGNTYELNSDAAARSYAEPDSSSRHQIPGIRERQTRHIFGSLNKGNSSINVSVKDEVDLVEHCHARVGNHGSDSPTFLKSLDEEAWYLVYSWGQLYTGLSSRRCIVAGVINGTGGILQIKSGTLVEGGSPCYLMPTREYDSIQGTLGPGGCIIFFGWGVVPSFSQTGSVFMQIESNAFICGLSEQKNRSTYAGAKPGYQVGFLEKSTDDNGWWAKYWLLVRAE